MNKYPCKCMCANEECNQFHSPPKPPCNCIRQLSNSTKFIERLLDCAETIVRVLSMCGIHQCKAKAAIDVIVFAFLHYKIVQDPVQDCLRKKLRKYDLFYDLGRKCRMNRHEAHVAYSIIKRAFKPFYYKQTADTYNPDYISEDQWLKAAEKTADLYASAEGLREYDKRKLECRIKTAYCGFIRRVEEARRRQAKFNCTCCFCRECRTMPGEKSFKLYANVLPKEDEKAFRFKQRLIEEGKKAALEDPDCCGAAALDWQNRAKAERLLDEPDTAESDIDNICTCFQTPCICQIKITDIYNEGGQENAEIAENEVE